MMVINSSLMHLIRIKTKVIAMQYHQVTVIHYHQVIHLHQVILIHYQQVRLIHYHKLNQTIIVVQQ